MKGFKVEKEIFRTGIWHGDKYTIKDIDNMVSAFDEFKGQIDVPLKLGHPKDQKILQSAGLAAAGWVKGLKRKGESLFAMLEVVTENIKNAIEKNLYKHVSSEIRWDYMDANTKKIYPRVLSAVALIGADIPEVKGLGDFGKFFDDEGSEPRVCIFEENDKFEKEAVVRKAAEVLKKEEERRMDFEKKVIELEGQVKELTTKNVKLTEAMTAAATKATAELAESKTKLDTATKELAEKAADTKEADIKAFMEKAKNDGKIVPANEKHIEILLRALSDSKDIEFASTDGKKETLSARDVLKNFVDALPKLADMKEYSTSETKAELKLKEGEGTEKSKKLDAHVKEYREKNKDTDYRTALLAVSEEHPELCEAEKL